MILLHTADPVILLLDMAALSNSIAHQKLIKFLFSFGDTSVIGITIQLLVDIEFVIINSEQVYTMTSGVPEGSALGPIFLLCILEISRARKAY